ncbi:hypothetical protein EDB85DRAFT_872938 [Lactarius pseudohatsudake]|nr:hypothetical protein EDB85DRAFT_872938 [Lactarius pseudohatsudake]
MLPDTVAPSLFFISSLASLAIIVQQLLSLHKSRWNTHSGQANRRILAISATLFTVLLSTLSGVLGLLASQARRVGDYSSATRATVSEQIIVIALQFGLLAYSLFILNMKALVEPIPSSRIGFLTLENVRGLTAVMSCPLVAVTVISTAFAALQEDYPAARFPAICWLAIFIPLFGVSVLLSIRHAKEHPIIARMWLVFAVGQACGALSATCAVVGKGEFQTPASLFDAFWSTCVTFALHSASRRSLSVAFPLLIAALAQFNQLYPIPIRTRPFRDETHLEAGDPRALAFSPIPLVPVISGHFDHCRLRSLLPRRIFALCRIRSPHPPRRSRRNRSLCLMR